jgi:prepilin-type processing-associated H-X9-DG protein
MPFFEEQSRYDIMEPFFHGAFASGQGINHPDLANVVNQPIPLFLCPSAGSQTVSTDQFQWTGKELALTNYKGIIGDTKMGGAGVGTPDCHRSPDCRGLFWRFSFTREIRFKNISDGLSKTFLAGEDLPRYNFHSGLYHGNGDYSSTHFPLNFKPIPPRPADWPTSITFRSDHSGGGNFAFLDGSVAFISDGINSETYRALSTRNVGELVTDYLQ